MDLERIVVEQIDAAISALARVRHSVGEGAATLREVERNFDLAAFHLEDACYNWRTSQLPRCKA